MLPRKKHRFTRALPVLVEIVPLPLTTPQFDLLTLYCQSTARRQNEFPSSSPPLNGHLLTSQPAHQPPLPAVRAAPPLHLHRFALSLTHGERSTSNQAFANPRLICTLLTLLQGPRIHVRGRLGFTWGSSGKKAGTTPLHIPLHISIARGLCHPRCCPSRRLSEDKSSCHPIHSGGSRAGDKARQFRQILLTLPFGFFFLLLPDSEILGMLLSVSV